MRSIFVNLKEHASLIVFLSKSTLQNAVKRRQSINTYKNTYGI